MDSYFCRMKTLFRICILFFGVMWLSSCNFRGKVREIPVNDFFKNQDKAIYRLSPNGQFLSYLSLIDKKQRLVVEDLKTGKQTEVSEPDERTIVFYYWVSDDAIIFYKEIEGKRFQTDLYIVKKDGSDKRLLSGDGKSKVRLLEDQLIDNKYLLVTSNQRDSTVFDVYKLNVRDGKMDIATQNPGNYTNWLTDNNGKLRMAISSDGINESVWYRENEEQPFQKIITNNFNTTVNPIAFSEHKPDIFYAISNIGRDKNALVEINGKTGKEEKILFGVDSLNVMDAQYSKRRGMMDFVICETWKKQKYYLSKDAKDLYDKIEKLLPDAEIRVIHQDKEEKHFIIRTFTDRTPGAYYLYDTNTNNLKKLSDINPSINEDEMCEMKPISYLAKDSLRINGYLTLPKGMNTTSLPFVVMPHHGPGLRNVWGYNAEVQFLANRGYGVLQINYRGSDGYGKNFYTKGFKQWGKKIQHDIDDGTHWLIQRGYADPNRIAIYGFGLGGFSAINASFGHSGLYRCAASNSGVLNLFSYLKTIPPFMTANLDVFYEIIGNPDIDAEYLRQVSPVFHANKVNIPVWIAQNPKDIRVNGADALQFVRELTKLKRPVVYVEKPEVKSVSEREDSRKKTYAALEQFLKENLKTP